MNFQIIIGNNLCMNSWHNFQNFWSIIQSNFCEYSWGNSWKKNPWKSIKKNSRKNHRRNGQIILVTKVIFFFKKIVPVCRLKSFFCYSGRSRIFLLDFFLWALFIRKFFGISSSDPTNNFFKDSLRIYQIFFGMFIEKLILAGLYRMNVFFLKITVGIPPEIISDIPPGVFPGTSS